MEIKTTTNALPIHTNLYYELTFVKEEAHLRRG